MKRSELLNELASRIVAIERPHPARVGIDGVDAAGKTTLANELVPFIEDRGRPVIRASIDGFHNPAKVRQRYIPGQRLYLQQCHPQQNATLVIDNNDLSNPILK